MPEELKGTPFESELVALIEDQSKIYGDLHKVLYERLEKEHGDLVAKKSGRARTS